jgi:peptide/nickel transport system permease protein
VYLLKKVPRLILVLLAVSAATFSLTKLLPGDPVTSLLPPTASDQQKAVFRHQNLLDRSFFVQYGHWLSRVFHGDLGRQYAGSGLNETVTSILKQRLPVTLELLLIAQVMALGVAIPVALLSAYRADSRVDKAITMGSFGALSIPDFALATVLTFIFATQFRLLPVATYTHLSDSITGNVRSMILPSAAIAIGLCAVYIRLLRADLIQTLQEDFILMARAQGLPPRRILLRHALRPSSLSLLTIIGINTGALIGGSVIVEYYFALPGIGNRLYSALGQRELLIVQGLVLVVAFGYVLINFLVDMLYSVIDPRIRHA